MTNSPFDPPQSPGEPTIPVVAPATAVPVKWWKRKKFGVPMWGLITAAVVLLFIIAGIAGGNKDKTTGATDTTSVADGTTAASTADTTPAETTIAETTVAPTTAAPTTTVAPTTTLPATTVPPAPLIFSGKGDDVVDIGANNDRYVVRATHDGQANFVVEALDTGLQQIDLAVNVIGPYTGTNALNLYGDASDVRYLQVTADGNWTLELLTIDQLEQVGDTFNGTGDNVVLYNGGGGVFAITHTGSSNFAVQVASSSGTDLLVNEIGNYTGKQPMPAGPAVIVVQADGPWTFAKT